MEQLSVFIISLAAAALLISLAETVVSQKAIKSVVRLCGGVIMALLLLSPLRSLSFAKLGEEVKGISFMAELRQEELQTLYEDSMEQGIQGELTTYIWDKAQAMGLDLTVSVATRMGSMGEVVPDRVSLVGTYSEAFSRWLEEELGVDKAHQKWQEA